MQYLQLVIGADGPASFASSEPEPQAETAIDGILANRIPKHAARRIRLRRQAELAVAAVFEPPIIAQRGRCQQQQD